MAFWAGAGLVLIVLLALAAVVWRRPQTADELLATRAVPERISSAGPGNPRQVLQTLVAQRWTGVMTIRSGQEVCTISILFGHVFDAECGGIIGEPALRRAVQWSDAAVQLEPNVRLRTRESITTECRSLLESLSTDPADRQT
jgi:hypothetical protein